VKEGSILVTITNDTDNDLLLPVPLQIDLRFIPEGSGGWGGPGWWDGWFGDWLSDNFGAFSDDADDSGYKGAFMPKTGIASILEMLLFGLLASLAATAAVVIIIRRQNAKEKGTLGGTSKGTREKGTREKAKKGA